MSDRLSRLKPPWLHDGEGADDGSGQGQGADERGAQVAQEQEDHAHHQHDGEHKRELHVVDGTIDEARAVVEQVHLGVAGRLAGELAAPDRRCLSNCTVLAPGWRCTPSTMARRTWCSPCVKSRRGELLVRLNAVDGGADICEMHRRAVLVGHDEVVVGLGIRELTVSSSRCRFVWRAYSVPQGKLVLPFSMACAT